MKNKSSLYDNPPKYNRSVSLLARVWQDALGILIAVLFTLLLALLCLNLVLSLDMGITQFITYSYNIIAPYYKILTGVISGLLCIRIIYIIYKSPKPGYLGWTGIGLSATINQISKISNLFNLPLPNRFPLANLIIIIIIFLLDSVFNLNSYIYVGYVDVTWADILITVSGMYSFILVTRNSFNAYVYCYIIVANIPGLKLLVSEEKRNTYFLGKNFFLEMTPHQFSAYNQQFGQQNTKNIYKTKAMGYPLGLFLQTVIRMFYNVGIFFVFLFLSGFYIYLLALYVSNSHHANNDYSLVSIIIEQLNIISSDNGELTSFNQFLEIISKTYKQYIAEISGQNIHVQTNELKYTDQDIRLIDSINIYFQSFAHNTSNLLTNSTWYLVLPCKIFINCGYAMVSPLAISEASLEQSMSNQFILLDNIPLGQLAKPFLNAFYGLLSVGSCFSYFNDTNLEKAFALLDQSELAMDYYTTLGVQTLCIALRPCCFLPYVSEAYMVNTLTNLDSLPYCLDMLFKPCLNILWALYIPINSFALYTDPSSLALNFSSNISAYSAVQSYFFKVIIYFIFNLASPITFINSLNDQSLVELFNTLDNLPIWIGNIINDLPLYIRDLLNFTYKYNLSFISLKKFFSFIDQTSSLIFETFKLASPDLHNNIYIKILSIVYKGIKYASLSYYVSE